VDFMRCVNAVNHELVKRCAQCYQFVPHIFSAKTGTDDASFSLGLTPSTRGTGAKKASSGRNLFYRKRY